MKEEVKNKIEEIYKIHDIDCNQKYDKVLLYSTHLKSVVYHAKVFIDYINDEDKDDVLIAAAGHDLIEDARLTYNDILLNYNKKVADIIYCCTDEKGKTREERHNEKYYNELKENRLAVYVKICDLISNVNYSLLKKSYMYNKYKKDLYTIKKYLFVEGEYEYMWHILDFYLSNKIPDVNEIDIEKN